MSAQVSPFQGLGNAQFFDNNGTPLTSGVLYSYQAGTTTQQATYTDSTGLVQNPNPVTFTSGGRVAIWTLNGVFYKFVLCLQNDGASCAPSDVLFSVDQVPGSPSSSGGGGGGGGAPFISNSANPATAGILRLASADTICWRNAANSTNLCISKDSSDVITWPNSALRLPEGSCLLTAAGYDYFCADQAVHRPAIAGSGAGSYSIIAVQGGDINASDNITQVHFGSTPTPLSTTAPSTGQFLKWDGAHIIGAGGIEGTVGWGNTTGILNGANSTCVAANPATGCVITIFASSHTLLRVTFVIFQAGVTCTTYGTVGVRDLTSSTNLYSVAPNQAVGTVVDSGVLSAAITSGDQIGIGILTDSTGCATAPGIAALTAVYQ